MSGQPGDATSAPRMRRSSRDPRHLRAVLESWLAARLPAPADPTVDDVSSAESNGMSSDTVLFDATWGEHRERLVARFAPDPADVPVFPSYDLRRQAGAMRLVRESTTVPVPEVRWEEPDPAVAGTPFFVMERVDGQVPPDLLPYTFGDSWLYDASREQQRKLQEATVAILAQLHTIGAPGFLQFAEPGETPLRRHVAHARNWYDFVAAEGCRSALIEQGFAWLERHWPAHESQAVLSWGDSRIGNIVFRDFEPVAVLDWEMAGVGPREIDLGWLVYAHRGFDDLAHGLGLPGMPHFMRQEDVEASYTALTGYRPDELDFYVTYAALQFAIVYLRTGLRAVHFGERIMPDDPDELLYNREPLERMLAV